MKTLLAISLLLLQGCAVTVGFRERNMYGGEMLCLPCITAPVDNVGAGIGFNVDSPLWFIFWWED